MKQAPGLLRLTRSTTLKTDVFSPNALGSVVNPDTLPRLKCSIIAGSANNQLLTPDLGEMLKEAGIVYAPDFVINGGGIINVAAEIAGAYDTKWVDAKIETLAQTLGLILDQSAQTGRASNRVALDLARSRIKAAHNARN